MSSSCSSLAASVAARKAEARAAVVTPNCRTRQLAGDFGNFPKVRNRQNSALLNPRMRDYAPSTGFEQHCNSDYTREDAVPSPRRRYLLS